MPKKQDFLCVKCLTKLTFTHWTSFTENLLYSELSRPDLFNSAYSVFYYDKGGIVQDLLHSNKYFNQPKIGKFISDLIPQNIIDFYKKNIDYVVIIPSHKRTLRERGYNQVRIFAENFANKTETLFIEDLLIRQKRKSSQTKRNRKQRFFQLDNSFGFNPKHKLKDNAKILLIDDLATTGSTLIHCAETIKSEMKNAEISVFTMAVARS
ncbi:hypothetical protein KRX57_06895 [Weeksellaceae bacterium TAE3-ERU29]|nr:hypothetical protein [Weeksellaceae bacterium TAE3-ERU29]